MSFAHLSPPGLPPSPDFAAMSCAGAPWVAPPTSSNPRSTRKEKKNPRPTLACLPSGAGSRVRDSTSTGPRGPRLVLHESMDAAGIDARQAREAREGFCQQVGRLTKIYSETSIAISRGPDLARAAMLIAAEDESLVSHSSAPLPVDDFIERLDDLSMDFCSLYLPPSTSPPEVFLANLERYIYVHKGFHRTCMMSDATALYLHSVLTCRKGSPIMLSLIYSEILKMLRIYGVLDFDVEIYFPHDQVGLPRGYEKQKSRLSDHPHILTSKSFLVEVLSSLKNAFWPFQNDKSSLFLRAAQAASHACGPTVSGKSFSKYSHGLDTAAMDSKHIGDMRRTLAACERLIILGSQPEELRDYAVLLYHCGYYKDCSEYLNLYQNSKSSNSSKSDDLEEVDAVKNLWARVNLILAERAWRKQTIQPSY